jgi:hypothetical protein
MRGAVSPAVLARLQRAASEIEGRARSLSRKPFQVWRMASGAGLHWTFYGADLLDVLERNGLTVVEKERQP